MAQAVQQPIPAHHLDQLIVQDTKSCPAIKYPGRQHAQFAYLVEKRFKIRPPELRARMKRLGLWNPDPAALHQKHHHPHSVGPVSSRPNGTKLHLNISGISTANKPEPMEPRSPLTPVASPIHQFSNSLIASNPHSPVTPIGSGPPMSLSSSMMTPPSSSSDLNQRDDSFRPTLPKLILSEDGGNTKIDICTSPSTVPNPASRPKLPTMMQHQQQHHHNSPTLRPIAQPRQQYSPSNLRRLGQLHRIDTQQQPQPHGQPPLKRAKVKVTSAALRARHFPVEPRVPALVVFKIRGGSEGGRKLKDARRLMESRNRSAPSSVQAPAPPSLVIGRDQMLRTHRGL
jgi:hypothetical protein